MHTDIFSADIVILMYIISIYMHIQVQTLVYITGIPKCTCRFAPFIFMPLLNMANTTWFNISLICSTVISTYEIHCKSRAYGFLDRHSVLIITTRICVAAVRLFLYSPDMGANAMFDTVYCCNHVSIYLLQNPLSLS